MTDDDKRLIELAARAMGYAVDWHDYLDCGSYTAYKLQSENRYWNPLTDDGDCARMEVALELDVSWYIERVSSCGSYGQAFESYYHPGDKSAARRRASVRAAAMVGESV